MCTHKAHTNICLCVSVCIYVYASSTTDLTRKTVKGTFSNLGVRNLRMTKIKLFGVNIKAPGSMRQLYSSILIPIHLWKKISGFFYDTSKFQLTSFTTALCS